jgi:hypothetical protein
MRLRNLASPLVAILLAVPATLVAPGAALAGGQPIDPTTLNPPLVHGNPVCAWVGSYIVCNSTVAQYHDLGTFDSGLNCAGTELSQSAQWTLVRGVAIYNAQKNVVKLTYFDSYTGSFSNPVNSKSVVWTQQDATFYAFTTPGDNVDGTATMNSLQLVRGAAGNVILSDYGTEVFTTPDYTRIKSIGHHPIDDALYAGNTSGLAPLCAALA